MARFLRLPLLPVMLDVNQDCLQLIFAHLTKNDLLSVTQVSSSFLTAALPHLYSAIVFHIRHAKGYKRVRSLLPTLRPVYPS